MWGSYLGTARFLGRIGLPGIYRFPHIFLSRELPLNLGLDTQGVKKHRYGEGVVFNASISVRNTLNSDITITSLKYCPDTYRISPEKIIGCSWNTKTLSSMVLKPGEERVLTYEDAGLDDGSRRLAFVVQYLYEGGRAENWLILRVTKAASTVNGAGTVTTRTVITPARGVTTTTILREPGTLDVIGWIARLFALIFATPFFIVNVMLWVVPVLLALIIGIPLIRKMRNRGSSLGALGATPSLATASHQTMLEVPHTTTVNPQETRRLRVPPDFDARCTAIHSTFQTAYRYYFGLNDERSGVRGLFDAVNALLNLIFEAEGISVIRLDDPRLEITMREKVRRLVSLGWISPNSASNFERLQFLRNLTSHSHEKLHLRLTEPGEVAKLFSFFSSYIPGTIAKLRALLGRDRLVDEKSGHKGPSYIG